MGEVCVRERDLHAIMHICVCVSVLCPTSCNVNGTEFPEQEKLSLLSFSKALRNSMSTLAAFKSSSTSVCDNKTEESLASKHNS